MSWCFADEMTAYSRSILAALADTWAEVTSLWTFEIANVLAVNERKGRIDPSISDEFLETLSALDIRVDRSAPPVDGKSLLPLVRRHRLTAYDTAYLELAQRWGLPLATFDMDLITAAQQAAVPRMLQA
jgi:predicted nucleic acid-binding protein